MSLYGQYIQERENKGIVESEHGFATYKLFPDLQECYIEDIYVVPEQRKSDLATDMADEISNVAKSKGYKFLTGSVVPSNNNSTASLKVLLAYGFKLLRSETNLIYFIKEL